MAEEDGSGGKPRQQGCVPGSYPVVGGGGGLTRRRAGA